MKLYATTTSERASKGQGGNKYLEIELKVETDNGYETLGHIFLDAYPDGEYVLKWRKEMQADVEILTQGQLKSKANKKKDEIQMPRRADWVDDGKDDTY